MVKALAWETKLMTNFYRFIVFLLLVQVVIQ